MFIVLLFEVCHNPKTTSIGRQKKQPEEKKRESVVMRI